MAKNPKNNPGNNKKPDETTEVQTMSTSDLENTLDAGISPTDGVVAPSSNTQEDLDTGKNEGNQDKSNLDTDTKNPESNFDVKPGENNDKSTDCNSSDNTPSSTDSQSTQECADLAIIEKQLENYAKVMSPRVVYSRYEGPTHQLILINVFNHIFVDDMDYLSRVQLIKYIIDKAKVLHGTMEDYLSPERAFRGMDDVKLPGATRENFCRLVTLVSRIARSRDREDLFKNHLDLDYIFEVHPNPKVANSVRNIILSLFADEK
jgi:hypothetical protein